MGEHRSALQTGRHDGATLEAVTFAAERFLAGPSWEEAIGDVMGELARTVGATRAALLQVGEHKAGTRGRVRTWSPLDVDPESAAPTREDHASPLVVLRGPGGSIPGGNIVHGRVSDFPEPERGRLCSAGVRSLGVAPVFVEGRWWGALSLEDRLREREFPEEGMEALKAIATMLGAAIQRQRTERELTEAETKFRTLVEQIPAVTYIVAIGGPAIPLYMSPQYLQIFGYTAEERIADPDMWRKLLHPDDREQALAESDRTAASGEPFKMEYRMIARDGRVVWVHDEAVLVRDQDGNPLFWQGVLFDITEHKLAEELEIQLKVERDTSQRLRELSEMKDSFLTAVSHELRSPLAAVLGVATTLHRSPGELGASEYGELLDMLVASARKLDRLLSDLLDLDRLARGVIEPRSRRLEVAALVNRLVRECWPTDRPIEIDTERAEVQGDASMVERIVENLLANAARHTPAAARVWVRVRRAPGGVLIAVEDAGPGVPPDLAQVIFEPFRQGRDVQAHSPGVGVGLALVGRFAWLHGGRAWVEDRPGGGASFRVFLPSRPPNRRVA